MFAKWQRRHFASSKRSWLENETFMKIMVKFVQISTLKVLINLEIDKKSACVTTAEDPFLYCPPSAFNN